MGTSTEVILLCFAIVMAIAGWLIADLMYRRGRS